MGLYTKIIDLQNLNRAWLKIKSNDSAPGIDGVRVDEFDRNIKENIKTVDDYYENFFDELIPTAFNYIDDIEKKLHFGFIAQDVECALLNNNISNFAGIWKEEYYNLNKPEFVALNTWQIQKAKARITELEEKVANLEERLLQ